MNLIEHRFSQCCMSFDVCSVPMNLATNSLKLVFEEKKLINKPRYLMTIKCRVEKKNIVKCNDSFDKNSEK